MSVTPDKPAQHSADPERRSRFELAILIVALLIAILCFAKVAFDIFYGATPDDLGPQPFDAAAAAWAKPLRSPGLTQIMTDITALGSFSVLVIVAIVILGVLGYLRDGFRAAHFTILGIGTIQIPGILKDWFQRPRPDIADWLVHVGNLSFPSGHAFGATSIYLFIAIWAWSWNVRTGAKVGVSVFAVLLILCVGLSRIYLGVHYATDVIGGTASGAAWALLMAILFLLLERQLRKTS